jgi:hypothetical protein
MADEGESSVWSFGWPTKIAAFFRPDKEEKTLKPDGVLLYRRVETFLWLFGGFIRPEIGDRMRERESPARGERDSKILLQCEREHGTPVQLKVVNRGSLMNWSCGCDWLDLKLIGRSGWAELWSGMARCTESLVHRVTWHNRIEGQIVLRAEMDLSFNLVW